MDPKTGGTVLVIIGILGICIGVFLILLYEGQPNECLDNSMHIDEQCVIAKTLYNYGVIGVIIGIIFAVVGGIVMAIKGGDRYQYTCPRCQATLVYQHSPTNCSDCGLPINWSEARMPKK